MQQIKFPKIPNDNTARLQTVQHSLDIHVTLRLLKTDTCFVAVPLSHRPYNNSNINRLQYQITSNNTYLANLIPIPQKNKTLPGSRICLHFVPVVNVSPNTTGRHEHHGSPRNYKITTRLQSYMHFQRQIAQCNCEYMFIILFIYFIVFL